MKLPRMLNQCSESLPSIVIAIFLCLAAGNGRGAEDPQNLLSSQIASRPEDWAFIDNGQVRLGVKKVSGGGIAWFSESGKRNLVNHWDHGRLIQQSYYGKEDGSFWNEKPWRWNPVQGGDWKGNPARLLELKVEQERLTSKSYAKHWASGADLTNVLFEQTITLSNRVAHVRLRFSYTGEETHPEVPHEIPAVFVEPDLKTLVLYDGDQPWTGGSLHRSQPGWPNESRRMAEHWAAYVGDDDRGIGVLVPKADQLTCYRFGDGKPEHGSCSYLAPITRFAITPGLVFEYDLYLTIGSVKEIRERFRGLAEP